jgi:hypothetical protein
LLTNQPAAALDGRRTYRQGRTNQPGSCAVKLTRPYQITDVLSRGYFTESPDAWKTIFPVSRLLILSVFPPFDLFTSYPRLLAKEMQSE